MDADSVSYEAIAFWPGDHTLDPAVLGAAARSGLRIEACGPEQVSLSLVPSPEAEGPLLQLGAGSDGLGRPSAVLTGLTLQSEADSALIGITGGEGVVLNEISLQGGAWASLIEVSGSADVQISNASLTGGRHMVSATDSQLSLSGVDLSDGTVAGIWSTSGTTGITLNNVSIHNISPAPGFTTSVGGFGLFVDGGQLDATDLRISNVSVAGILADATEISLTDVSVAHVTADGHGQFGRGIHLMNSSSGTVSSATLTRVTVTDTQDTAVFIQRIAHTDIAGLDINTVGSCEVPAGLGGGSAADGLVVTGRDTTNTSSVCAPESTMVNISDAINIVDPTRATLIADGARVALADGTEVSGKLVDTVSGIFFQNGGEITSLLECTDLGVGSSDGYYDDEVGPQCINLAKPGISAADEAILTTDLSCATY
jgi:hypothetical protein